MESYMNSDRRLHTLSRPDTAPRRSALYPVHPQLQRNSELVQQPTSSSIQRSAPTRHNSTSCLPTGLLAPGMDPSTAEFRNFFPYIPNEVKHRKRTSQDQARVLEAIFAQTPKPDGKLRSRLALELDMKPRGVQVWFQNRRAKEKLNSKKAQSASGRAPATKASPAPKQESPTQPSSPIEYQSSPSSSRPPSSSPESSPPRPAHGSLLPDISRELAHSLSPEIPAHAVRQSGPPDAAAELYILRRGSLPNLVGSHSPLCRSPMAPPPPPGNQLARRGSVERLRTNPFSQYAHSRPRPKPYASRQTSLRETYSQAAVPEDVPRDAADVAALESRDQHSALAGPESSRRMLSHRASMPHGFSGVDMHRRASMPANMLCGPSFRVPVENRAYISSRTLSAPIPGPLPSPGFSFGPPADAPVGDYPSTESGSYNFGENDTEDDATSGASYDAWSRFGSIASTSSNSSAYFSEVGSCNETPQGWNAEARRNSYASSDQFSSLVSRLDLSQERRMSVGDIHMSSGAPVPYAPQDEFTGGGDEDVNGTNEYPSPSSTVSPGPNQRNELGHSMNASTQSLPISGSSELAHALRTDHEPDVPHGTYSRLSDPSVNTASAPYSVLNNYPDPSETHLGAGAVYTQAVPTSSSMGLVDVAQQKSYLDMNPHHYSEPIYYQHNNNHNTYAQQPPVHSGYQTPYDGQAALQLHHAMEYQNSGFVSTAVNMSHVTSAVENALHAHDEDLYLQYP